MFGFGDTLDRDLAMHSARAWRDQPEQCRRACQYAMADAIVGAGGDPPNVPKVAEDRGGV